jgi:hypothetical protein
MLISYKDTSIARLLSFLSISLTFARCKEEKKYSHPTSQAKTTKKINNNHRPKSQKLVKAEESQKRIS